MQASAIINVLPKVGDLIPIYFTVIDTDNSLNQATITSCEVLYGNVAISNTSLFRANDNLPIAIAVTATWNAVDYLSILYTKCVYKQIIPDNYMRLLQKIPKGVFTKGINDQLIGDERNAVATMINNYYQDYFFAVNQVYSNEYSPQLEYEYNGSVGLLSNSTYTNELFQLLARAATIKLNSYDLELFVSTYIYYRTGVISAVYIDDHVDKIGNYWILGETGHTELDQTTILAPDNYKPVIKNLKWTIYNSSTFDNAFKNEIRKLIIRMSRADIGNPVIFSNIVDPVDDGFELIGPTYPNDPRLIYNKCLQYIGDAAFPLNIIGYKKIITQQDVIIVTDTGAEIEVTLGGDVLGGEII
jgi:hypothetical protein